MQVTRLPPSALQGVRSVELTSANETQLQGFFEANPQYFMAVHGERAGPNEAYDEIHGGPPAGWCFTKKWLIGYQDADGSLVAVASVISDLLAPNVWHIGLFLVATSRHGMGDAQSIYHGLESWASSNGAEWFRLGVVQGNTRAERFWEAMGFQQTRTRGSVAMGKLTHTLRVMFKPLAKGTLEHYLSIVERDCPESSNTL